MHTHELEIGEVVLQIREPEGFDALQVRATRNALHGFDAQTSETKIGFTCGGGYEAIKAEYDLHGVDATVYYRVYCGGLLVLNSEIIFSTASFEGGVASVDVAEVSFSNKYKARLKTTIDLSSTVSLDGGTIVPMEQVTASLHSQPVSKISHWAQEEDSLEAFYLDNVSDSFPTRYLTGLEGSVINPDELVITSQLGLGWTDNIAPFHFYEVSEPGLHTIDLRMLCNVELYNPSTPFLPPFDMKLLLVVDDLVSPTNIVIRSWTGLGGGGETTETINIDETYSLGESQLDLGWKLSLYLQVDTVPAGTFPAIQFRATLLSGSFLHLSAATTTRASRAPGYLVHEVLEGLMNAVVGPTVDELLYSDYYGRVDLSYPENGCGSMRLITNGLGVRNVPDSPVSLSLDTTLKSLKAIDAIGANLERFGEDRDPLLRVEHFTRFYNPVHNLTLTHVTSYKETVATEVIYNTIEVGYKKWETESAEGRAEVHTKREYATPIQKYEGKYEAISDILAGGTAIETQRRIQFDVEPRKDARYDKDNFIICLVSASLTGIAPASMWPSGEVMTFPHSVTDAVLGAYEIEIPTGPNAGTYAVTNALKGTSLYLLSVTPPFPVPGSLPGSVNTVGYASENVANSGQANVYDGDIVTNNAYNLTITPLRNFYRHGQWLNIGTHYKADSETYRFTAGEGNYTLQTFDNDNWGCIPFFGVPLPENHSPAISEFNGGTHPAQPNFGEGEAYISASDWLTIKNSIIRPQYDDPDAYGYIRAVSNGNNDGYLWDFAFQYATGKLTFKLLKKN